MTSTRRPLRFESLEDRTTPATPGGLDPTFGENGRIPLPTFDSASPFVTTAIAVQPDNSVTVVGRVPNGTGNNVDFGVARYTADGHLDPSFGSGGTVRFAFDGTTADGSVSQGPTAVAVEPDGSVVVVGVVSPAGGVGSRAAVARLTATGSLDPTFDGDGKEVFPITASAQASDTIQAVAVQPDGRIVLAGSEQGSFLAARLLNNGAFDPTFDGDGKAVVPFPLGEFNSAGADSVAVQADGRIVLGGIAQSDQTITGGTNGIHVSVNPSFDAAAVRLNADGSLDSTFADGGRFHRPHATGEGAVFFPTRVQPLADGSLIFVNDGSGVALRLTPGGTIDPTYGTNGTATVGLGLIGVQPDGGIVYFASVASPTNPTTTTPNIQLGRLTADGQPDPTYGTDPLTGIVPPSLVQNLAVAGVGADGSVVFIVEESPGPVAVPVVAELARAVGTLTAFPPPAGSVLIGGTADGAVQLLAPTAAGFDPAARTVFYGGFTGTVRTALADVNGDGVPDLIGGAGPGGSPVVTVVDGATADRLDDFLAFEPTFTGGVFVTTGDVDGDGKADVIVTPDQGGGPVVAVFGGAGLAARQGAAAQLTRFFGIDDPAFRGGARAAAGDLTGDGAADLVVSAGFLGGPRVAVYDGKSTVAGTPVKLVPDFFAFESTLRNGAFVSLGDVTGDGKADLVFGGGPGGGPRVRVFDGAAFLAARNGGSTDENAGQVANFFAGDAALRGGVHVALKDVDGDGKADLLTGSGDGEPAAVRMYRAATVLGGAPTAPDQQTDPFDGATLATGVFVG